MSQQMRLYVGDQRLRAETVRKSLIGRSRHDSKVLWAAEAGYEGTTDLGQAIGELVDMPHPPARPKEVEVVLHGDLCQVRTLEGLPEVSRRALKRMIQLQPTRYFRGSDGQLITDAQWLQTSKGAPVTARATAVDRSLVEAIIARVAEAGLWCSEISVDPVANGNRRFILHRGSRRSPGTRRASLRLVLTTAALWLLVPCVYTARLVIQEHSVRAELAALDGAVSAVASARREMGEARQMIQVITEARRSRQDGMFALATVSAELPDNAFLTSYNYDHGMSAISGYAERLAEVMAALEEPFPAARVEGQVTREIYQGRELERFTIILGPVSS